MPPRSPIMTEGGVVIQAGMNMTTQSEMAISGYGMNGPYRALVLATYVSDNDNSTGRSPVECDVVLVHSNARIKAVPVMQRNYGLNDASQLWIPKAATRTISGDKLNLDKIWSAEGTYENPPTALDDTDGDMVLVDFIERNKNYPIIIGALPHERSKRSVIEGDGWSEGNGGSERGTVHQNEAYERHAGTEVRINASGDYLVDTVGATSDTENETPGSGGQVRFRIKGSKRFTVEIDGEDVLEVWKDGGGVHVDLGEGATEHIILGDAFMSFFNSHFHDSPSGLTDPPLIPMTSALLSTQHRVK